jgi:hypothetical protein
MPINQAVGMYSVAEIRSGQDEIWKTWELPYWQGVPLWREMDKELEANSGTNFAWQLLALTHSRFHRSRLLMGGPDRELAMLRTVEALRDYAARHHGQPPTALTDIKCLPIPLDPLTGKSFQYEVNGNSAILDAPVPEGASPRDGRRLELTFVAPKAP